MVVEAISLVVGCHFSNEPFVLHFGALNIFMSWLVQGAKSINPGQFSNL